MLPYSTIAIQNQILSAGLDIPGTSFSLHYSSDRHPGHQTAYTLNVPLTDAYVPSDVEEVRLEVAVAGRQIIEKFPPQPNLKHTFIWDGLDSEGQICSGPQPATLRTSYIYPKDKPPKSKESTINLGIWNALNLGLGGWSLNVCHKYEIAGKTLYLGNGQRRTEIEELETQFIRETGFLEIPSEGGGELYIFDRSGRHLRTISTLTKALIYSFEYNDSYLTTITDGDGNITRIEHATDGTPLVIVGPYGQRSSLSLNADGYLGTIANAATETTSFTYSNGGLLTSYRDPKGNIYRFEYDELGQLKSREEPDGSFSILSRERTKKGFQVAHITASGRESTYLTERLANGKERQVNKGCAGAGAIVALTDKDGNETITYPDGSTLIEEKQPDPRFGKLAPFTKRSTFKSPGGRTATVSTTRTVKLTDPDDPLSVETLTDTVYFNGRVSTTTYDAVKGQVTYTSPGGRQSILSLDEKGRVTKSEIPGLEAVRFSYGERGELLSLEQGEQTILSYSYDERGRLSRMRNAEGNEVSYAYDESGRIVQSTLPSGKVNKFGYDANGNLTEIIVPSGAVHRLSYNEVNAESGYAPPDNPAYANHYDKEGQPTNAVLPSGRTISGSYNKQGYLERATYPEATVEVTYEKNSQRVTKLVRTSADESQEQEMTFTYDGGLVKEMAWRGVANGRYRYRYDDDFNLVGTQLDEEPEITMERDADGLLTRQGKFEISRDNATGAPRQITDGNLNISIEYDKLGRVVSRTHEVKGKQIYQFQLVYDELSRIVQKRETVAGKLRVSDYTYDADGQMIEVKKDGEVVESYKYDLNGNRIEWELGEEKHSASYDSQDRLKEVDGTPYEFDADGFLMQRGDMTLKYSATGELLEVSWPDGKSIQYAYDSMNRRVARTDDQGTQEYLYGNLDSPFQVTGVRKSSGGLDVYHYDESGLLVAMQRDASWYYVVTDQLGSPQVVGDVDGGVVKVLEYESFGKQVVDSNYAFDLPVNFAGGLIEVDTEFVRFGFRDYDSVAGKWTAKDPIGFAGGDGNLYGYVINNPVNLFDPLGLSGVSPVSGSGGIYPNNKKCPSKVEKISESQKNRQLGHPYDQIDKNVKRQMTAKEYKEYLKKLGKGGKSFIFVKGVSLLSLGKEIIEISRNAKKANRTFEEQFNFELEQYKRSNPQFIDLPFFPLPVPNPDYHQTIEIWVSSEFYDWTKTS